MPMQTCLLPTSNPRGRKARLCLQGGCIWWWQSRAGLARLLDFYAPLCRAVQNTHCIKPNDPFSGIEMGKGCGRERERMQGDFSGLCQCHTIENPLRILLVYALTLGGSAGDPQWIFFQCDTGINIVLPRAHKIFPPSLRGSSSSSSILPSFPPTRRYRRFKKGEKASTPRFIYYSGIRIFASDGFKHQKNLMHVFSFSPM